jgi:glyoxalase family protein
MSSQRDTSASIRASIRASITPSPTDGSNHEITGLHHVTAITGDPQVNLDFYTTVLGMRLVKKSVNQDVPDTYHLFYADAAGTPGTDLTFFPWPNAPRVQPGPGLATEVSLAVRPSTLGFWTERLAGHGVAVGPIETRHGERALPFRDPSGFELALVETADEREFVAWQDSPVASEYQILGLHAVRLWERERPLTERFLIDTLGFTAMGAEGEWHRYGVHGGGSGRHLDIRQIPDGARGRWGVGGVHHVAWRVADEAAELSVRARVAAAHRRPTDIIDRFWFKSVYFLEPGGVLFELATEGPGFSADEPLEHLGEQLVLPPWLEKDRPQIEAALQPLRAPE